MKKLFLTMGCIAFCFLMSCKDSTSTTATADTNSQAEKNKANSKEVYYAIQTGNVSGLDSIIDKDFIDHAGEKGDVKGIDSLKKFFADIHNHINDIKFEQIANATDGDYNFDLNRMTGTTNSNFMGMPANTKFDMMGVDVVKIKDGKATEHWGFSDPKDIMKMMQNMKPGAMEKMNKMDSAKAH